MDGFALNLESAKAWCERNKIAYLFNSKLGQIGIPRGQDRRWMIRVIPRPERKMCTIALPLPLEVPTDRMDAMRGAINLANSMTFMGAWVMNQGKGELYFRVTLPTDDVLYSDDSLKFVLQVVIGTVERVAQQLRGVALEGADPSILLPQPDGKGTNKDN